MSVDDVVSICRNATAHNFGQTIISYGSAFLGDEVTVELSSWPRMQEARRALEAAGFNVVDDNERTLTVRPAAPSSGCKVGEVKG